MGIGGGVGVPGTEIVRKSMKAKLRAWLIDLVCEAIRVEMPKADLRNAGAPSPFGIGFKEITPGNWVSDMPKSAGSKVEAILQIQPSFEQMQADAIQEQAKFYEVVK